MCDIIWYLSFYVWLTSLSVIISRSIHVAANGQISFFFMPERLKGQFWFRRAWGPESLRFYQPPGSAASGLWAFLCPAGLWYMCWDVCLQGQGQFCELTCCWKAWVLILVCPRMRYATFNRLLNLSWPRYQQILLVAQILLAGLLIHVTYHNSPARFPELSWFYGRGNWGSERLNDTPTVPKVPRSATCRAMRMSVCVCVCVCISYHFACQIIIWVLCRYVPLS